MLFNKFSNIFRRSKAQGKERERSLSASTTTKIVKPPSLESKPVSKQPISCHHQLFSAEKKNNQTKKLSNNIINNNPNTPNFPKMNNQPPPGFDFNSIQPLDEIPSTSLIPQQNEILRDESIVKRTRLSEEYVYAESDRQSILGQGVSGPVLKLKNIQTGRIFAMKQIRVNSTTAREVTLHYIAQKECEYVTGIEDIFINRCHDREYFYLIMEYCEGGELFDAITGKNNRHFTERQVASIVRQISTALLHLHTKLGIAHRDLKPENVLLKSKDPSQEPQVRLSDFGFAKQAKDPSNHPALKTACYTPYYAAPEIFGNERYNVACDVWSLGVILYIMLTGEPPFYSIHGKNAMTPNMKGKLQRGDYKKYGPKWEKISGEAQDLIKNMLDVNKDTRITIRGVMAHPYITKDLQMFDADVKIEFDSQDQYIQEELRNINQQMGNNLVNMRHDEDINFATGNISDLAAQQRANASNQKPKKKFGQKNKRNNNNLGTIPDNEQINNAQPQAPVNATGDSSEVRVGCSK